MHTYTRSCSQCLSNVHALCSVGFSSRIAYCTARGRGGARLPRARVGSSGCLSVVWRGALPLTAGCCNTCLPHCGESVSSGRTPNQLTHTHTQRRMHLSLDVDIHTYTNRHMHLSLDGNTHTDTNRHMHLNLDMDTHTHRRSRTTQTCVRT